MTNWYKWELSFELVCKLSCDDYVAPLAYCVSCMQWIHKVRLRLTQLIILIAGTEFFSAQSLVIICAVLCCKSSNGSLCSFTWTSVRWHSVVPKPDQCQCGAEKSRWAVYNARSLDLLASPGEGMNFVYLGNHVICKWVYLLKVSGFGLSSLFLMVFTCVFQVSLEQEIDYWALLLVSVR